MERVDDRSGPRFAVKLVERPQHGLRMRPSRNRVPITRSRPPGHRVGPATRYPGCRTHRRGRLAAQRQPAAEVAGLHPCVLIPRHVDGQTEPEPAQQIHRIRALRCRRPTRRLQVLEERPDPTDHGAARIDQTNGLPHVIAHHDRPRSAHDQGREVTFFVKRISHVREHKAAGPQRSPSPHPTGALVVCLSFS